MLRSPQTDRMIKLAWRVLLVAFVVSMLTWIPANWVFIFTSGITLSTIFLSITLITGMAGQLSLAQGTLAGVGAFTVAQLSLHLHLTLLLGILVGAVLAAVVAAVLAIASLRLQGIGLSLLTIAAALFFDNTVFPLTGVSGGLTGVVVPRSRIGPINFESLTTRPFFVLAFIVLTICTGVVILVRRGTIGWFLGAIRGSQTAASGIGINLSRNKVLVFALSGAIAAIGGAMSASLLWPGQVSAPNFNYEFSLVYVVVVVTTGVSTVEGAIQAGMGFVVIQQLLGYLPPRFGAGSLTYLFFAFGAFTYAAHPEGILEYQKRRSTLFFDRHLFKRPMSPPSSESGGRPSPVGVPPVPAGGEGG
jgi:branched-chain amino acid transport system permease protein